MSHSIDALTQTPSSKLALRAQHASPALARIVCVHAEDDTDRRIAMDWTGRSPRVQSWEIAAGVARCVLSSLRHYFDERLILHGIRGLSGSPPAFASVQTERGTEDIPADAVFFLEDHDTNERFVMKVEDRFGGDYEIAFDAERPSARIDALRQVAAEHNYLRGRAFNLSGEILDTEAVPPSEIVLTTGQAEAVRTHILGFAEQFERLKARGGRLSRGVLLEGPPGCGKSMLLRSLIHRLPGFSVCFASPGRMASFDATEVLTDLIKLTAPCAVFFEEIDMFGTDRRRGGGPGTAELMQLMDGLSHVPGVLWIATTNRPDEIEEALADRPGRLDRRIEFGPLDRNARSRVLDAQIKPQSLDRDARTLALDASDEWTGAQLRELCETLRLRSDAERFGADDVADALDDCGFERDCDFGFSRSRRYR